MASVIKAVSYAEPALIGGTANTNRLHSESLWKNAPVADVFFGNINGWYYKTTFSSALSADTSTVTVVDQPDWDATVLTAGTALTVAATAATGATQPGGILQMDAGDTTANHGIQLQHGLVANIFLSGAAGEEFWYETRVRPVGNVTGDYVIGIANTDTTITDGTSITTTDHIAWTSLTGDGVLLFNVSKASTPVTATGTTLVADTWVKLGYHVYWDGIGGVLRVQQHINGVPLAVSTTQVVPNTVAMRLSLVCQNSTTTRAKLNFDWIEALHVYASNV